MAIEVIVYAPASAGAWALQNLGRELTELAGGYTTWQASGNWDGPLGAVMERTNVVVSVLPEDTLERLREILTRFKKDGHQEEVLATARVVSAIRI